MLRRGRQIFMGIEGDPLPEPMSITLWSCDRICLHAAIGSMSKRSTASSDSGSTDRAVRLIRLFQRRSKSTYDSSASSAPGGNASPARRILRVMRALTSRLDTPAVWSTCGGVANRSARGGTVAPSMRRAYCRARRAATIATAAGVIPGIRAAWPSVAGRMAVNRSEASRDRPGTPS